MASTLVCCAVMRGKSSSELSLAEIFIPPRGLIVRGTSLYLSIVESLSRELESLSLSLSLDSLEEREDVGFVGFWGLGTNIYISIV
jgi:hypothetical protein